MYVQAGFNCVDVLFIDLVDTRNWGDCPVNLHTRTLNALPPDTLPSLLGEHLRHGALCV